MFDKLQVSNVDDNDLRKMKISFRLSIECAAIGQSQIFSRELLALNCITQILERGKMFLINGGGR